MQHTKILIVEDENDISELMLFNLNREGFSALAVGDGHRALEILEQVPFDLVILDWMLPGVSGLEICRRIRQARSQKNNTTPVLMVTARSADTDVITGLEVGADDYIAKPFNVSVLLSRVRALLRRATPGEVSPGKDLSFGALSIDIAAHTVTLDGEDLLLTASEFKLLVALIEAKGRVLSRERLVQAVQGYGVNVTERTIDTHVYTLRKKLGKFGSYIEGVRSVGYRAAEI